MKYFILGAAFLFFTLSSTVAKELPSYIQKCKKDVSVEELEKCVIDRAQKLMPRLTAPNGLPELKLPSIEPLRIPEITVSTNNINISFKNIEVFGLQDIEYKKARFDFTKKIMEFLIVIPFMRLTSNYQVKGKLILFELNSSGPSSINITGARSDNIKKFDIKNINGKDYVYLGETAKSDVSYKNGGIRLENVFPGNEQLTNEVNKVLNENFEDITKDVNPLIFDAIIQIIDDGYIGPMLREFSLNELFD